MQLALHGLAQMNLEKKNNLDYVQNKINYKDKELIPDYLDNKYGYLLESGFYNYQEYVNYQASKAQEGDSEALELCMYYFGWRGNGLPKEILGEYYFTLISGGIDIYQKDKMSLIRLFSTKNERNTLKDNRPSKVKGNLASKKMTVICDNLANIKSSSEVLNDLTDLLMDRILNYKPGKRTLRKYIYDMYYLYVGDYIQKTLRSRELVNSSFESISYDDTYSDYTNEYENIELPSNDSYYEWEKRNNSIGVFWVMGHTHPYFEDLTKIERLVLRENIILGNSQIQIANSLGVGRTTIRTNLNNAKRKIEKSIKETDSKWIESKGYEQLYNKKREG